MMRRRPGSWFATLLVLPLLSLSAVHAAERGAVLLRPVSASEAVPGFSAEEPVLGVVAGKPVCDPVPVLPTPPRTPEPKPCDPEKPARSLFEFRTPSGGLFTVFPGTLLWEPPLASKSEPRLELLQTNLSDAISTNTLDTYIGATAGLFRYTFAGGKCALQLDAFALAGSRISNHDYMIANDFRAGLPISFQYGPWHGKFGYEHTSTHLGDDIIVQTGRQPIPSVKDEVVLGLDRWFVDWVRVYGEFGYAFFQDVSVPADPIRFAAGVEVRTRKATGIVGRPFAALHVNFAGDQDYDPNLTVQLGWMWRNPAQRLANFRLFGEYYTGKAPFGQLYQEPNQFFAVGVAIDY